jgi:hypothetical protein
MTKNLSRILRIIYLISIKGPLDLIRFSFELRRAKRNPSYVNSRNSYELMRKLYVISGGYLFETFNRYVVDKALPKKTFESGIRVMPTQDINVLKHLVHMNCFAPDGAEQIGAVENFLDIDVGTIRINAPELFACKPIAELITHELWLSEAQKIIGNKPIAVGVDAWWSKPTSKSNVALSDAAQLWHRDLDRLRDVKIFF